MYMLDFIQEVHRQVSLAEGRGLVLEVAVAEANTILHDIVCYYVILYYIIIYYIILAYII